LEEVSRAWKARGGGVMVDAKALEFGEILKALEGSMVGGRVVDGGSGITGGARAAQAAGVSGLAGGLVRQNSLLLETTQESDMASTRLGLRPSGGLVREDSNASFGMSALDVEEDGDDSGLSDPRRWLKVVDAFSQPRYVYNIDKRHFERFVNPGTAVIPDN
jgi:DNA polymerase epsilon subunit 2